MYCCETTVDGRLWHIPFTMVLNEKYGTSIVYVQKHGNSFRKEIKGMHNII